MSLNVSQNTAVSRHASYCRCTVGILSVKIKILSEKNVQKRSFLGTKIIEFTILESGRLGVLRLSVTK